jgi:hypothetical protein
MDAAHPLSENTAQVDDSTRAGDGATNAGWVSDIGPREAELADLRKRLDDIRLSRVTLGDPDSNAAFQQEFADIPADESATAEDGYKLFRALDHWEAR